METVIEIFDIKKNYQLKNETIDVLKGINMNDDSEIQPIKQGEFLMIRGSSGGGKSSFLNLISTLDKPTSGIIKIFGCDISEVNTAELRLKSIGIVFQSFNLIPSLTCSENIELPMLLEGKLNSDERFERTNYLLYIVKLLQRADSFPADLSGGEQQRIAIARSLSNDPKILFMDEPTGDLDRGLTEEIMDLIKAIHKTGKTIIMVTHDDNLEVFADRIIYFQDGMVSKVIDQREFPPKIDYFSINEQPRYLLTPFVSTEANNSIKSNDMLQEAPREYSELTPLYIDGDEEILYLKNPASHTNPDEVLNEEI